MQRINFQTSLFFYLLTFLIVFKSVDFTTLHDIRLEYLAGYLGNPLPVYRILLYDYLVHLKPDSDDYRIKLANNEAVYGDYANAIKDYQKAISLNPQNASYKKYLEYCYKQAGKV